MSLIATHVDFYLLRSPSTFAQMQMELFWWHYQQYADFGDPTTYAEIIYTAKPNEKGTEECGNIKFIGLKVAAKMRLWIRWWLRPSIQREYLPHLFVSYWGCHKIQIWVRCVQIVLWYWCDILLPRWSRRRQRLHDLPRWWHWLHPVVSSEPQDVLQRAMGIASYHCILHHHENWNCQWFSGIFVVPDLIDTDK